MKRNIIIIFAALFFCACSNTPEPPVIDEAEKYFGEYEHFGSATNLYIVKNYYTNKEKQETTVSTFENKALSIYKLESGSIIAYGDRYGFNTAEIKDGALVVAAAEGEFEDDGSLLQRGTIFYYQYYHYPAKFVHDTLTWRTTTFIHGYNASGSKCLDIYSDIINKAVKKP